MGTCKHDESKPVSKQDMSMGYSQNEFNGKWLITLCFHSLCYQSTKISSLKDTSSYFRILLLLGNDLEVNPGPVHQLSYTLNHPYLCGFYRTALYNIFMGIKLVPRKDNNGEDIDEVVPLNDGINDIKNIFGNHFDMSDLDFTKLKKNKDRFLGIITKWGKNRTRADKELYFKTFSVVNWLALNEDVQVKHSISCSECEASYLEIHVKFPANSPTYSTEKKRHTALIDKLHDSKFKKVCANLKTDLKRVLDEGLSNLQNENGKPKKITKSNFKSLSMEISEVVDNSYLKNSNNSTSFQENYSKCKQLEPKKSYEEKRTTERKVFKKVVDKIQEDHNSNCVNRLYGGNLSLRAWDRERKRKSFESVLDAQNRSAEENMKIESHKKKKKDHIGNFSSYNIDTSGLESNASTWDNSTEVVWKQIGEKYVNGKENNVPKNCGQIVKEYLLGKEAEGSINLSFQGKEDPPKTVLRRSLKKVGQHVSVPVELRALKVREKLHEQIISGEIDIGESIFERQYQKLSISKTGDVVTNTFTVEGRKHPLRSIRKKLFIKYHQYMRLNSDAYFDNLGRNELFNRLNSIGEFNENENIEFMRGKLKQFERTRHLQIWHDGSTIANHGHILFCVNILYDPAVFFTSKEYKNNFGLDVHIQRKVETPELYIIGRCRNNDEQLGYIETRIDCLKDLENALNVSELVSTYDNNIHLKDVMRMFHGDGPASALEAGNQKGGHYFCPSCDIHICETDDISCCYQKQFRSLPYKQNLVLEGKFGKINSEKKSYPFENLNANQLRQELISRNVDISHLKETKKDLVPILKKVLKGIKRVPIIMMQDPLKTLQQIGLGKYEVAMIESMHDLACHIENVIEELPHHMKESDRSELENLMSVYKLEKDKKRCCDWRKILLALTQDLYQKIDGKVHKLLKTLTEIQRILYLSDDFRSPKEILRLHNSCFEHYVLLKEIFNISHLSSAMTRDKLFGKYAHNLMVHAPIQYRLVSGESINAEDEERVFNTIQTINKGKTNYRPGNLIGNLIVRLEYETINKTLYEFEQCETSTLKNIRLLGANLEKKQYNSLFTYTHIQNNIADWQSHLQRIADFLIFENVWWQKTEFGIEFFDCHIPRKIDQYPKVHHFRSSNITNVMSKLEQHWSEILSNNICIPTPIILEGNEDEPLRSRTTNFLEEVGDLHFSSQSLHNSRPIVMEEEEEETEEDLTDFTLLNGVSISPVTVTDLTEECPPVFDSTKTSSPKRPTSQKKIVHPLSLSISGSGSSIFNEDSIPSTSSKAFSFLTREAKAIYDVLKSSSPLLESYDNYKNLLKQKSNPLISDDLLNMQAELQTQTLRQISLLKKDFEKWERIFMLENDRCFPRVDDIKNNDEILDIYHRIKVGEQLLKSWNISFS